MPQDVSIGPVFRPDSHGGMDSRIRLPFVVVSIGPVFRPDSHVYCAVEASMKKRRFQLGRSFDRIVTVRGERLRRPQAHLFQLGRSFDRIVTHG